MANAVDAAGAKLPAAPPHEPQGAGTREPLASLGGSEATQWLAGYVDVGFEYTVFETCEGGEPQKMAVSRGDAADRAVRRDLLRLSQVEGVFLGQGRAKVVLGTPGVEGPYLTKGRATFLTFELLDTCPGKEKERTKVPQERERTQVPPQGKKSPPQGKK